MASIFCETNFFENWDSYSKKIPCGSKISLKLLFLARFSRYKYFCVLQFLRKIRKFKMAAIFGKTKLFGKLVQLLCRDTLKIKNFVEITLSSTVFKIKTFLCCNFCEKFANGRHFWRDNFFLKIGIATLQRYPVGQKFRRNCSISHGVRDISIFVFSLFGKFLMIN